MYTLTGYDSKGHRLSRNRSCQEVGWFQRRMEQSHTTYTVDRNFPI